MPEQPKSGSKGYEMEEALRAYFFEAGYFVVRGLLYQLDGEDITDVDLWLYERPAAATRRRIIVDIKNKKSPKAAERIIWTKGLQEALGVDAAIVATTDRRASPRILAKSLGVTLFDGDAIARVTGTKRLSDQHVIRSTEIEEKIREIDSIRRSNMWRDTFHAARSSILSGMGVHSANKCLSCCGFFAQEATLAYPNSIQAQIGVRLTYSSAALSLISLDYVIADHVFRTLEERRKTIINAVRYGQASENQPLGTIDAALNLTRKYVTNGTAAARQIALGFSSDAEKINAEIIADFMARASKGDAIFHIARELENASNQQELPDFDALSIPAKSALGAFLDFNEVSRESFARSWKNRHPHHNSIADQVRQKSGAPSTNSNDASSAPTFSEETQGPKSASAGAGPLFDTNQSKDKAPPKEGKP